MRLPAVLASNCSQQSSTDGYRRCEAGSQPQCRPKAAQPQQQPAGRARRANCSAAAGPRRREAAAAAARARAGHRRRRASTPGKGASGAPWRTRSHYMTPQSGSPATRCTQSRRRSRAAAAGAACRRRSAMQHHRPPRPACWRAARLPQPSRRARLKPHARARRARRDALRERGLS